MMDLFFKMSIGKNLVDSNIPTHIFITKMTSILSLYILTIYLCCDSVILFRGYLIRLFTRIFISLGTHLRNVGKINFMLPKIIEFISLTYA